MNFSRFLRSTPALAGVLVCALLVGCATPQVTQLRAQAREVQLAPQAELHQVPFYAQKEYECGPAALAMVMAAAGVAISPDDLVAQVYLPARKGSLQVEMLAATRQHGLLAYVLKPRLQDLLQEVAAGHPVLVFENVSLPIYPVWHYAVVVAYDLGRNTITLHSGETERMEMSLYTFERTWGRGQYWAMLAQPPAQLPATAEVAPFARSAAALEGQHADAARLAYGAALQRWPQHGTLLFGLGNSAYAMQDLPAAAQAYAQAVAAQPDFADAWNNLAQAELELGHFARAQDAIARAVALGGVRLAQYQELQAQIARSWPAGLAH
jgi:tetratricopeptide (TPR) repeat protein